MLEAGCKVLNFLERLDLKNSRTRSFLYTAENKLAPQTRHSLKQRERTEPRVRRCPFLELSSLQIVGELIYVQRLSHSGCKTPNQHNIIILLN